MQSPAPALKNRPGVIVIHGGGWIEGAKDQMVERFCVPLVRQDFVVANIEYRLAGVAAAPAAVIDVLHAARWFRENANRFKVNPDQILTLGVGAGGHLALMIAMTPPSAELGDTIKIAAVLDFAGIADVLDQLNGPHQQPYAWQWIPDQPGRMDLARRLSPLTYVRKGLPPILIIHGDADPIVPFDESQRLEQALRSAGDDSELITIKGGKDAFPSDELAPLWPQIFKWLKKRKITP